MNPNLDKIKQIRLFLLKEIEQLTVEQLNKIPEGFNNNIIWNLAHLVASMQSLCYIRADLPLAIHDKYVSPYLTNTKPLQFLSAKEIEDIKSYLIATIDILQTDLDKGIFNNYTPSPNVFKWYKINLNTIDDALAFLLYHDGYHTGSIMALKRLVNNN
ncbi:MAG: DinB family protein [Chitinophagaceae bacterium]|nr:DinB family protein [Chitinophagaceae bacterium]